MMRTIWMNCLEIYTTLDGDIPFLRWLESFTDGNIRFRIKDRLDRVTLGNLGDYKVLQEGLSELRLSFGPGYRIYFSPIGNRTILLLCGGNKSTQQKDIQKAIFYWNDYLAR